MTPPYQTSHDSAVTISADGKCTHPLPTIEPIDEIDLIIDGNFLSGGIDSSTLLGDSQAYLAQSSLYQISHFETLSDGRCRVQYTKRQS